MKNINWTKKESDYYLKYSDSLMNYYKSIPAQVDCFIDQYNIGVGALSRFWEGFVKFIKCSDDTKTVRDISPLTRLYFK